MSIAEGIIADRQVDVVMGEAEPDWAGKIARLDRQWEIRFRALDQQWNLRFVTFSQDWEARVTTFDRQWVELAGSLQRQLVESRVKAHFGGNYKLNWRSRPRHTTRVSANSGVT